jgi:two-component system, OmpR family, sensor histidine kinase CiaH
MQNESKPYGEKATASFETRFLSTIWILTLKYTVVLAAILLISSGVLYSAFSSRLGARYAGYRPSVIVLPQGIVFRQPPSQEDVRKDFVQSLVVVNGMLLVLAGIVSYFLARTTLDPIKKSYEKQQKFLADASHELRTPLAILQLDMENELANTPNEQTESHLEEVKRMSKIVADLLSLSRIDRAQISPEFKTLEINGVVEQLIKKFESLASQEKVTLVFEKHNEIKLKTSSEKLEAILSNLLKNAVVYNKPGGLVTVSISSEKNLVTIKVADTGVGIQEHELPKIFDRFYRTDKSRSRQSGGTGLGLSIVHSTVQELGGSITVKSKYGEGTEFTLKLPKT